LLDRGDGSVCFAFRSGVSTFLGATPERLVSRRGPLIRTEALAGSAAADDPAAVETLRLGDKDRREHAFVVNEIVERLLMLGAEVSVPEKPALRQFGPVLHLRTSIEATRLDAPHVLVLAHHLHPTPAVGGIPLQVALDFIRNNESFQRGRYASPVGWFGCNGDGELVVALRSGLVRGREIRLFAGAGLVNGSEAQAEWRETELKFRSFLDALGVYTEPSSFTPS
jgi:menaquinone-specific isochorismate synthase